MREVDLQKSLCVCRVDERWGSPIQKPIGKGGGHLKSNAIRKSFLSVSKELRLYLEPLQARGKDKGSAAETPLSQGLQEIFMTLTRTLK